MLLEELNSEEVNEFLRKRVESRKQHENEKDVELAENITTTTTPTAESSTENLIHLLQPRENNDESRSTTTINTDDVNNDFLSPPKPPMLLSEFADQLVSNMNLTTISYPDFPTPKPTVFSTTPDESFPYMVNAAKEFIRRYLSPEQWRKLRILLKTMKEVGGSRMDIHRAATLFISKVISKSEMDEITSRRGELFRTFSRRFLNRKRKIK
ncbi:unnamed protein product [Caenorhabditis bovis]|uniref:Uncharacterized protein n=1 Tax=Caenorhabditis bovis TaxID=2654633 RepID=A0A8S1EH07_9PELO|nr:unnamed protein product [Caenorhabditis bovis]